MVAWPAERQRETRNQNSTRILIGVEGSGVGARHESRVESRESSRVPWASERKRFVDFTHAYVWKRGYVRSSRLIFTGSPRYFVCARDRNLVYPERVESGGEGNALYRGRRPRSYALKLRHFFFFVKRYSRLLDRVHRSSPPRVKKPLERVNANS